MMGGPLGIAANQNPECPHNFANPTHIAPEVRPVYRRRIMTNINPEVKDTING